MTRRLLLATIAALALAGPAAGADIVIGLSVHHGPLALDRVSVLQPARAGRIAVEVVDARGTGKGWVLLAASALPGASVASIEVSCGRQSTCTLPRTDLRYPIAVGARRAAVLAARAGTGMGAITVVLTLTTPVRAGSVPAFSVHAS